MVKLKTKSVYTCNECGASSPKWVGQCPSCGAWNTLHETTIAPVTSARAGRQYGAPAEVHNLAEVSPEKIYRHPTGISELDRVLGGGLVSGSVVLIGGDPVVLWGMGLPVEEVAEKAGTISYELLCHVTERIPRVVI